MIVPDLNGDRVMDVIVRTSEDEAEVYCSQGTVGYAAKAAARFDIPVDGSINVEDMNSDGLSDILVSYAPKQALTVYFSTPK